MVEPPRRHWVAHPSFLRCAQGHRLFPDKRHARLEWLVDGIVLAECRKCQVTSYLLSVVCRRPTPWAACYALTKPEYENLAQLPDDLTVMELFALLHIPTGGGDAIT